MCSCLSTYVKHKQPLITPSVGAVTQQGLQVSAIIKYLNIHTKKGVMEMLFSQTNTFHTFWYLHVFLIYFVDYDDKF